MDTLVFVEVVDKPGPKARERSISNTLGFDYEIGSAVNRKASGMVWMTVELVPVKTCTSVFPPLFSEKLQTMYFHSAVGVVSYVVAPAAAP
jgi:hypothetical protein